MITIEITKPEKGFWRRRTANKIERLVRRIARETEAVLENEANVEVSEKAVKCTRIVIHSKVKFIALSIEETIHKKFRKIPIELKRE